MKDNDAFSFEKLEAWQLSRSYCKKVYLLLGKFPAEERYGLCDQLRRSVISVPSNIAEGCGRISLKEKVHFIEIAFGSLMESYCQLQLACDLDYITPEELDSARADVNSLVKMLKNLRRSYQKTLDSSAPPT